MIRYFIDSLECQINPWRIITVRRLRQFVYIAPGGSERVEGESWVRESFTPSLTPRADLNSLMPDDANPEFPYQLDAIAGLIAGYWSEELVMAYRAAIEP